MDIAEGRIKAEKIDIIVDESAITNYAKPLNNLR